MEGGGGVGSIRAAVPKFMFSYEFLLTYGIRLGKKIQNGRKFPLFKYQFHIVGTRRSISGVPDL